MTDHENRSMPEWKGPVRKPDPTPEPFSKFEIALAIISLRICAWSFLHCCATRLRSIASDLAGTAAKRRSRAILADVNAHRSFREINH